MNDNDIYKVSKYIIITITKCKEISKSHTSRTSSRRPYHSCPSNAANK